MVVVVINDIVSVTDEVDVVVSSGAIVVAGVNAETIDRDDSVNIDDIVAAFDAVDVFVSLTVPFSEIIQKFDVWKQEISDEKSNSPIAARFPIGIFRRSDVGQVYVYTATMTTFLIRVS